MKIRRVLLAEPQSGFFAGRQDRVDRAVERVTRTSRGSFGSPALPRRSGSTRKRPAPPSRPRILGELDGPGDGQRRHGVHVRRPRLRVERRVLDRIPRLVARAVEHRSRRRPGLPPAERLVGAGLLLRRRGRSSSGRPGPGPGGPGPARTRPSSWPCTRRTAASRGPRPADRAAGGPRPAEPEPAPERRAGAGAAGAGAAALVGGACAGAQPIPATRVRTISQLLTR